MSACGDELVSLVEGPASRLANDVIFLAETKVATFGGVGVWLLLCKISHVIECSVLFAFNFHMCLLSSVSFL